MRGIVVGVAACLLVPAFSQTSTGNSGGTTSTGTRNSAPATNTIPNNSTNTTAQPTASRPLRVSGRVVIDDGSPLSFPATIERVCNGNPHAEGYTDSEGNFSLVLGQHPDVIADASETPTSSNRLSLPPGVSQVNMPAGGPGTSQNLSGDRRVDTCELRASLSGYTSDSINLTGRTALDSPDVGNIVLHRMGAGGTAMTVTATTLKAPRAARKAMDKGLEMTKKNKPEEAIASLEEAVRIYPEFAFAWCELGKLQMANDHIPDAHESFEAAAKAEPRWPEPYLHLAVMAVKAHDWKEVAGNTERVLQLNTFQYPQAYFLHGAANFNLHHIDVAETDALAADKLDIQHQFPQIQKLLGAIYGERHRYADAADKLRAYLLLAPDAEDAVEARRQLTEMESLASRSSQVAKKAQQ
jgi:tetratricopeptide (TPR) repeat protein